MLDLNGKKIEKAIDRAALYIRNNRIKLQDLEQKRAVIVLEEKSLKSVVSEQEFKVKILRNALMASRGVSRDVAQARDALISCIQESKRKDILISRKEGLEIEIQELKKRLQKLCKHQFVIGRVSYESYDMGETSWVMGYRLCVVCAFGENATDTRVYSDGPWHEAEDKFPTLNKDNNRVIDEHGIDSRNLLDIWQPLEEVLKRFIDERIYEIIKT